MIKIIKIILIAFIFLSATTVNASSDDDYSYEIKIVKHLKEDETIKCNVITDDKTEEYTFDDRDDQEDKTINEEFQNGVHISCNKNPTFITLKIFNTENKEIYSKTVTKKNSISYKLILKHAEFYIKNPDKIDLECNLLYDDTSVKHKFKNTRKENIDIDFTKEVKLSCNNKIKELKKIIYNDNYDKISYELKRDSNTIEYKKGDILKDKETLIFFGDKFKSSLECYLKIDKEKAETIKLDKTSKLEDRYLIKSFSKNFNIKCRREVDNLNIYISDIETEKNLDKILLNKTKEYTFNINSLEKIEKAETNKTIINKTEPIIETKKEIKPKPQKPQKVLTNPKIEPQELKPRQEESSFFKSRWFIAIAAIVIILIVARILPRRDK